MTILSRPFSLLILVSYLLGTAYADEPLEVENFALIDHGGKFHELDYYCRDPQVKGIVLFVQGNGCPLVRKRIPKLKRLRDSFQPQGILFGMLNANLQDGREDLVKEAQAFDIDLPILKDDAQVVARMLKIERTAEALLIDSKTSRVVFRGPIDDRLSYQTEKPEASEHYLAGAIRALLAGETPKFPEMEAPGCRISFAGPEREALSYRDHVAPVLKKRCVQCHTEGGVGPFAMSSYSKVKGWSEMIAEVILTKQMPPWHADPHIGTFANDSGMTPEEARTVSEWIRAGSPRGEGPDPLEDFRPEQPEWVLGTPDAILDLPSQEVPAEGIVEYRYVYLDSPFDRDVWLRAAEIKPGNTQVLHHVIVTSEKASEEEKPELSGQWITGYAPGTAPATCPEGTGVFLPRGHRLKFQLHYTVSGREEEDLTRLGFYLLEEAPPKTLKTHAIAHSKFRIPPHDREYREAYTRKIEEDILIHGVNPHMHFRGKWMHFTIQRPDGSEEPLLSVPNYNFNWQRTYHLAQPVPVAAGSELIVRNAWDNSAMNLYNPDPTKSVRWGDQSFEEMFFATFTYVKAD